MATAIGETLQNARSEQGLSLADAARATRIREQQLAALEQEQFNGITPVYAKGFLRAYARYLGLDAEQMVECYRERHDDPVSEDVTGSVAAARRPAGTPGAGPADQRWSPTPVTGRRYASGLFHPAPAARSDRRGLGVVALVALLVIVGVALVGLRSAGDVQLGSGAAGDGGGVAAPPAPPASAPIAAAPAPARSAPARPAPARGVEVAVTIKSAPTWLRVISDGEQRAVGVQPVGYRQVFRGNQRVELRVGDASRVSVVYNGREQRRLGRPGQVANLVYRAPG